MGGSIRKFVEVKDLTSHSNYKHSEPVEGESVIAYTLRCASHLVSPPMEDGEDNEFECVDVARQILALEKKINEQWNEYKK